MRPERIFTRCLAALFSVLTVLFCAVACRKTPKSDGPLSPGLSVIHGEPIYDEGVALRTDHYTVSEGMLAYFFYGYGLQVMERMEQNKTYDASKNLHDQMYTETESWYDTIMNATLAEVCRVLILCESAESEGVALSEEAEAGIETELYQARYNAAALSGESLTAYLQRYYGPKITEEDYAAVLRLTALAELQSAAINARIEGEISAEEALSYAQAHNLSDESFSRNIAYLTVKGDSSASVQANAQAALKALQESPAEGTLESLNAFGTVGKEKNLIPENTNIKALKDWLFAGERKIGDVEVLQENGVTYVALYCGTGATRGEVRGRMALYDLHYAKWHNDWAEKLHFGYNYDIIDRYDVE